MALVTEWKASYYCITKKSWIYGNFSVFPQFVQFTEDGNSDIIDLKVYFDEFVEMKKETTNIFYTALTIRVNDQKYWFSSFPSCTNVYNMLEHFWKEKLFAGSKSQGRSSGNSRGQQMLRVLHDSAGCLSSTAKTLETQGQQIDGACRTMNKLHNDLGIAEKLIHDMDSWLSQFNVTIDDVMIDVPNAPDGTEKTELPVLYGPTDKDKHLTGSLVIGKKTFEILDMKRNIVHSFNAKEISEGTFHTPYEVTIINSEIGKLPVFVHVISARLVHVVPQMQAMLGPKLMFEDPADGVRMEDSSRGDNELMENLKLDATKKENIPSPSKTGSQPVSDAEAAQMSKLLQDMKSMAVGIKDEQDRQLKQLDLLTNSVDKANARLRKNNMTVNHLK